DEGGRSQQRGDALLSGDARDGDDSLAGAETKLVAQRVWTGTGRSDALKSIDIYSGSGNQPRRSPAQQAVVLKKHLVITVLEYGQICGPRRQAVKRAIDGRQYPCHGRARGVDPAQAVDRADEQSPMSACRQRDQQVGLGIKALHDIRANLGEKRCHSLDCLPVRPRADEPIEGEWAIVDAGEPERPRVSGAGGSQTKAAGRKGQHEGNAKRMILAADIEQMWCQAHVCGSSMRSTEPYEARVPV